MSSKKIKRQRSNPSQHTTTIAASANKQKQIVAKKDYANLWAAVLLFMLAFILYGASVNYGYILDDEMVITKNNFVQKGLAGLPDIFRSDSFLGYFQTKEQLFLLEGGRYRPLSLATFAAEIEFFGANHPAISHFINIVLYAFTGLMLFKIIKRLNIVPTANNFLFPFLVTALWILHPIHVEAVVNIKGRDEILALLGSLIALWASIKYVETAKASYLAWSGVCLLLGLFSKESAITFLAIIPLTLWMFKRVSIKELLRISVPLVIASVVFILVRYEALGYWFDHGKAVSDLMNQPFVEMTTSEKYATIFYTLGWYIKLLFIPHPLTHDYYPYHVPKMHWSDVTVILSLLLYVAMTAWAVYKLRSRNIYAYCILFFLATISIVSNLVFSIGAFMNERFLYAPSIAFCIAVAFFFVSSLEKIISPANYKKFAFTSLSIVALLFTVRTMSRVPDWKDPLALDTADIKTSSNSARENCFYAVALYTNRYVNLTNPVEQAALVDTMELHINKALAIYPNYEAALQMNTGIVAARYQLSKNVDVLLKEFKNILVRIPKNEASWDFIIKYLNYLQPTEGEKVRAFCYDVGYTSFYQQKKDDANAIRLLQLNSNDKQSLQALKEVYLASGNKSKAMEVDSILNKMQ